MHISTHSAITYCLIASMSCRQVFACVWEGYRTSNTLACDVLFRLIHSHSISGYRKYINEAPNTDRCVSVFRRWHYQFISTLSVVVPLLGRHLPVRSGDRHRQHHIRWTFSLQNRTGRVRIQVSSFLIKIHENVKSNFQNSINTNRNGNRDRVLC